jgi:succinylarginine dihydrolase
MSPYGKGVHFFVHGRRRNEMMDTQRKFPSRQTELASRCVAQAGHLNLEDCFFARQSSAAIEAGVFHNDVIAVGQGDFLFCHAQAFEDQATTLKGLQEVFRRTTGGELIVYEVPADLISLEAAVETYLFNSQILKKPNGRRVLVVPENCRSVSSVWTFLEGIIADESCPIEELLVQDLSQSMRNGGGPACLRLRVYLSSEERNALSGRVMLDASLYSDLCEWVERNYRSQLVVDDLADIQLYGEVQTALAELEQILKLPGLYTQTSVKHNYAY